MLEKIGGLTVLRNGDVLVVNDNDGVDDSNGEDPVVEVEETADSDGLPVVSCACGLREPP